METFGSIEIDRPIEEVFDYTMNHATEWSNIMEEHEMIHQTDDVVGSTFRLVTVDRGRRMEFEGEVTYHRPPTASSITMRGKQFNLEVAYQFEDLGVRTKVSQRSVVHAKGFMKLMLVLFGWMMKKSSCDALDKEFASLKEKLETKE